MPDHDADVAALPLDDIVDSVADALQVDWDAQPAVVVRSVRADAEVATNAVLAALTAAGIRCFYVPEGVEVEHGARLVLKKPFTREGHARGCSLDGHPCDCTMRSKSFYVIEDTP